MSLHACLLMIRGNHIDELPGIFEDYGYQPRAAPTTAKGWDKALDALEEAEEALIAGKPSPIGRKLACLVHGWTMILDPELVMVADEAACLKTSRRLKSRMFTMVCEGSSATYAYGFYEGNLVRSVWYGDGTVDVNKGPQQPEEGELDPADLSEEAVLGVMRRMGVDYEDLASVHEYYVYEFDESGNASEEPAAGQPKTSDGTRPWWRFWA
jgi:hypothetical protein